MGGTPQSGSAPPRAKTSWWRSKLTEPEETEAVETRTCEVALDGDVVAGSPQLTRTDSRRPAAGRLESLKCSSPSEVLEGGQGNPGRQKLSPSRPAFTDNDDFRILPEVERMFWPFAAACMRSTRAAAVVKNADEENRIVRMVESLPYAESPTDS
jgi:hypothetical protein